MCSPGILIASLVLAVPLGKANLLQHPSFEQVDEATGYPLGWKPVWGKPTSCAYTLARARTGAAAALITDPSPAESHGLRSQRVRVTPGRRYQATVHVWVEPGAKPGFALYLEFWDPFNRRVRHRAISTTQTGRWRRLEVTLDAPPHAAAATVLIYSGSTATGRAYFDDAALIDVSPGHARKR